MATRTGFRDGPFAHVWFSPLFTVPKSNMDGSPSEDVRVVHHQSWPAGASTNDVTISERHMPARTPSHRTLVRLIVYQIVSWPGVPIRMAKRDCNAAFKRVFLQLGSIRFFASLVRGLVVAGAGAIVVMWLALIFGWTASPGE